jgi:anti-sigma B factor antagonist
MPEMRTHLTWRIEIAAGSAVLHLDGEVDMASAPALVRALAAAFDAGRPVIVDLDAVRHLDSAGLHILEDRAREHPSRLVVVSTRREMSRLFDIFELTGIIPVVGTVEAAQRRLDATAR